MQGAPASERDDVAAIIEEVARLAARLQRLATELSLPSAELDAETAMRTWDQLLQAEAVGASRRARRKVGIAPDGAQRVT